MYIPQAMSADIAILTKILSAFFFPYRFFIYIMNPMVYADGDKEIKWWNQPYSADDWTRENNNH